MPCVPLRTPFTLREPASTQTRLSPKLLSCSSSRSDPALPIATTQTTAAMPMVMPNAASPLRSLLRESPRTASDNNVAKT